MKLCSKPTVGVYVAIIVAIITALISADAFGQTSSDRARFEQSGQGRAVVFIPGLTSSGEIFRDAGSQLEGTHNHYVTLAGFAGIPAPDDLSAFTRPAAQAVSRYIEEMNLTNVFLVGHSMGGVISLLVAADHPDRVSDILIVDSVPFLAGLNDPNADPAIIAQRQPLIEAQFNGMTQDQYLPMMQQGLPVQATSDTSQAIVWDDIVASDQSAVAMAAAEIFSGDFREVLPDVEADVTVLVPYNDYAQVSAQVWKERYSQLYEGTAHLDVRIIDDSRHFIMLDQPEVFADILTALVGE